MADQTYPTAAGLGGQPSVMVTEVQTSKTNMLAGLGAVTENANPPPPTTDAADFLFGTA